MNHEYPRNVNDQTYKCVVKLMEIAELSRHTMQSILSLCDLPGTTGLCLYSAIISNDMLNKFTEFQAQIKGGDGHRDGGYIDSAFQKHGHYWNEVTTPGGIFIFDMTADQFPGGEEMAIYHVEEPPAERYIAGDQNIIDEHVRLTKQELIDAVEKKSKPDVWVC